ncbi:AsmA family protein [Anaeromyxobacter oryzisoli]|uniref:AsmA family protein n=1 Tax=Anaeromyxobacter oryzisoli TaxID=2925408 RepID=UPI001F58B018|nr:AsmA family protein [Anaeromyxobacter sp. SG63]
MADRPWRLARRIGLVVGALAGALVLLLIALVLLVDSGAVTRRVTELVLPRASAALGRDVTVRGARLGVLPHPHVRFDGLRVAGRPGEPALAEAEALDVEVGFWPLLLSRGREVDIRAVSLVRLTVNVVRAADGSWSFEGLGARAAGATPLETSGGGRDTAVAVRELRIEDGIVRVVDRSAGAEAAVAALTRLELRASGIGAGRPLSLRFAAALASDVQNLHADLKVSALPATVPGAVVDWPAVEGSLRLVGLPLERIRALLPGALGHIVRAGNASLDATVTTAEGAWRLDGHGDLADLSLRGQPASGHFRAAAALPLARLAGGRIDLTDLVVRGPGVELGGHARVELSPLRVWFVVTGPLLDLDAVMGILPEQQAAPAAPGSGDGGLLPSSLRRQVAAAQASGTVEVGTLRAGRVEATHVKARATLRGGVIVLEDLQAAVFGGRISGAGTRIDLAAREPAWRLVGRFSGLDLAAATKALSGDSPLAGALGGTLDVKGTGTAWAKVREKVSGLVEFAMKEGVLTSGDLGAPVLAAVAQALHLPGRGGAAGQVAGGGRTPIHDLAGSFTVRDGFLTTRAPVRFRASFGDVHLGGRVGLAGQLELSGTAAVPWSALTGQPAAAGRPATLDVPLRVGGTLESPSVNVDVRAALAGAASGQAKRATGAVQGAAKRAGRRALDVLKGLGDRLR